MALTTVPASLSATALTLTTAAQPNITSVGTLTGLTVSGNIAGTLTTAAQTNITSVGTLSALNVGNITSTGNLSLNQDGANIYIGADLDLRILHDGSNGTFKNDTGNLTIDVAGDITLDADGADINFQDGGTLFGQISNASGLYLVSTVSDAPMYLRGNDGGSYVNAIAIDFQNGGSATFSGNATVSGNVTAGERVIVTGNTNSYSTAPLIYFDSTSTANAGVRDWAIGPADDSYGNFHIFVGASTGADPVGNAGRVVTITNSGKVGIGESSPGATLHVKGSSGNIYGRVERASASQGEVGLWVRGGTAADYNWYIYQKNNDSALHFYNQQDRLTIDSSGKVGIGKSPSTWRLDVDSTDGYIASFDGNSNTGIAINSYSGASDIIGYSNSASSYNSVHIRGAGGTGLVVDTSNNVGIGTSAPYTKLQVEGTVSDTYTPTAFLDKQQVRIRHPNAANNYGGIGFTNSAGNYEWFIGSNQTSVSPAIADFVIQGADSTSGYTENMRIDCGGHVTMPKQPYVQGRGNGGWAAFSASAIWEIQPHGSTPVTSLDRNSDYSTTNKRFTCPVDGVYLVCASWYIYQTAAATAGSQYLHPALYKNGNIAWNSSMQPYQIFGYEINRGGTGSKHYDGVQMTYTIYCSANDYLDIRCYTPNANTQSYENYHYFSYTLLS